MVLQIGFRTDSFFEKATVRWCLGFGLFQDWGGG